MDETLVQFGEKVRWWRKKRGLSQDELAALSGLHRTYIGSVERGEQNISLRNILKIAASLGIPASELFNKTGHDTDDVGR